MARSTALLAIPLALLLAACGSAPTPVDHHFRLIAASPDRLGAPVLDGALLVKRFSADGLLAQRPVVYAKRTTPQALYQYNYNFWVDTPTVMLQELTARMSLGTPVYEISGSGPDHDKRFTAITIVDGVARGHGAGTSKKRAEQVAARSAYAAVLTLLGKGESRDDHA